MRLFSLGLTIGLCYLPLSLQLAVSLSERDVFVRSLLFFIYPLGLGFMGLGALASGGFRAGRAGPGPLMRLSGLLLLLALAAALRFNFFSDSRPALLLAAGVNLACAGAWFACLGLAVSLLLRGAAGNGAVAGAWAAHLAGLLAGYLFSIGAVNTSGASAALACAGAALALSPRFFPLLLAAFLALSAAWPLDAALERLRDTSGITFSGGGRRPLSHLLRPGPLDEVLALKWSRFVQVAIVRHTDQHGEKWIAGYYNYFKQFELGDGGALVDTSLDRYRRLVYAAVPSDGPVFAAAVGPGRGLAALPFPPDGRVTAVDQDEAMAGFFLETRPDLNGRVFEKVRFIRGDARRALEAAPGPFSGIILESAVFAPSGASDPAGTPKTLYTREAVDLYLSKLSTGGVLIFGLNQVLPSPELEYLPLQLLRRLRERAVPLRVFAVPSYGRPGLNLAIAASSDEERLVRLEASLLGAGGGLPAGARPRAWTPATAEDPRHAVALTDDRPFTNWITMDPVRKSVILSSALLLAALCVWLLSAVYRRSFSRLGAGAPALFFLLGAGHTALVLASVLACRSSFGDSVTTGLGVMACCLLYGAAGSLLSGRLFGGDPSARSAAVFPAALALHGALLLLLPAASAYVHPGVYAAAALLPGCLLTGALFAAALSRAGAGGMALALFSDFSGGLAGYMLYYLVCLPAGVNAYLAAGLACYAAAFALFLRGATWQAPPPGFHGAAAAPARPSA